MKKAINLNSLLLLFALVLAISSCTKSEVITLTLDKSTSYLLIGETDTLSAKVTSTGDVQNFTKTWTTSNPDVATIINGVVTGVASGTATITVKAGYKTATCEVTVDDKILPTLTKGELWYFGDAYETTDTINGTGSNNFILYLASSGINLDNLTGNGEMMIIELNTGLTFKDNIPAGTYNMMTNLSKASDFAPFTLVPAYTDSYENSWGCWYYGILTDPLSTGNMIVSKANNIYTLNYIFYDDYGVKISGTYQGSLNYVNATTASSIKSSAKKRLRLKSENKISKIGKTMTFIRM